MLMRSVILLSALLGTVLLSALVGFPPTYYVYMAHEILLVLVFSWFIYIVVLKDSSSTLLEGVTLFFLILFVVLSPVTKGLAPDYQCQFTGDPVGHVDYLVEEIGERPYLSENEVQALGYIQSALEAKGFIPDIDCNAVVYVEGKRDEAVIFCAHYDTVPGSPGADDNASGVSILLGLTIPETPEYTIILAFFTGEETGLVESRQFAHALEREVAGVICVDTVGLGEDFHISSMKENRVHSFFLSQVVYGLSDTGVPSIGPLNSDHVPFNERGIRAVGLTRSFNRTYPHIHSERDVAVDRDTLVETGETVQKVVTHFSNSEHPYTFVYGSLIISVVISGVLALFLQRAMHTWLKEK